MSHTDFIVVQEPTFTAADEGSGSSGSLSVPVAATIIAVLGLAETAWIHLKDLSNKFAETPYLGVGYAALVVAAVVSAVMIATGRRRGWILGGAACVATIASFVLTRTTGLPSATGDIGNWSEPAGVYALVAEGTVVLVAGYVFARARRWFVVN